MYVDLARASFYLLRYEALELVKEELTSSLWVLYLFASLIIFRPEKLLNLLLLNRVGDDTSDLKLGIFCCS